MSETQMIPCKCPCGQPMGEFAPWDDHSGVIVRCPKCKQDLHVANGLLGEILDDLADDDRSNWDLPLELSAIS